MILLTFGWLSFLQLFSFGRLLLIIVQSPLYDLTVFGWSTGHAHENHYDSHERFCRHDNNDHNDNHDERY